MARQPDAKRTPATPSTRPFSLISDAQLKQVYARMLTCRMADDHLRQSQRSSQSRHLPSSGYEAALVGAAIHLRREDWLLPGQHQGIGTLIKGEPLPTALSKNPASQRVVPSVTPLDSQLDMAIGLALAAQALKKGEIAMVFSDAAPASARLRQSLEFAAERCLPLVVLVTQGKASANGFAAAAQIAGVPVIPVDQGDVIAMYRVAFESIHKGRHDGGPTVIEAVSWNLPVKSRARLTKIQTDPITRMEAYLSSKGLSPERWKRAATDLATRQLAALRDAAKP